MQASKREIIKLV